MKSQIKIKGLLTTIFLIISFIDNYGQDFKFNPDGFSINPKLAYYNWTNDDGGFMGGAEINLLQNDFVFSADYYRYEEWILFSPTPGEYFNQIGLMLGKYKGDRLFRFQYQAGLATFWGLKRTELIKEGSGIFSSDKYESDNFFTIGLTTKLGFKIVPLTFLSIGIDLQTNINPENTVYMPMISIEIGKLRNKINEP